MKIVTQKMLLSLLLLLGCYQAMAAGLYQVEVLVFAREDLASSEYLPPDPGRPDLSSATSLEQLGYPILDSSRASLGPEKYTLSRQGDAEPLFHQLWQQPMRPRTNPQRIYIISGTQDPLTPPLLEGVLEIGAGRFFHLGLDLVMRGNRLPPTTQPGQPSATHYQTYRLSAQRKMSRNEVHYIDHPRMGVLVVIRR